MSPRALIVEDYPPMAESLADMLDVLGHTCETAGDMKTARECLARTPFDYLILDMAIPVASDRLPDREVGRQLLAELRARPETALLPVLVITGEDQGDGEFIQSVLRTGGYDTPLLAYLQKRALTYEAMNQKVQALLSGQPGVVPTAPPQKPVTAFSALTRRVIVYRHRVDVCDVAIWTETESGDLRKALLCLKRKDADGRYRSFSGNELAPDRNASNKIGPLIKRFRDNATVRLRADRDLECGPEDIIANERRKGYYLREWIEVEEVDADGPDESTYAISVVCQPEVALPVAVPMPAVPAPHVITAFEPTKRQQAILTLMASALMTQKELLAKLHVGKSTVNRDLATLRDAGLFIVNNAKQYALTEAGRVYIE